VLPLVTIVVATRNRAELLQRALRGALAQTHSNLEIVVVDDCSTDHTKAVVDGLADPRLAYVRHDVRRGGAAARNTGIALANGEFLCFLDDDDEYPPQRTAVLLRALIDDPSHPGVAYGKTEIFINGRLSHIYPETGLSGMIYLDYLGGRRFTAACTLFRREAVERFDEALPSLEYSDFLLRVLNRHKAIFVDAIGLRYHADTERPRWSTELDSLRRALRIQEQRYLPGTPRAVRAGFYTSIGFFSLRGQSRNSVSVYCFRRAFVLSPTPWNLARLIANILGPGWVERYQRAAAAVRRRFAGSSSSSS
jgi:glycosyltransferase involved in cell wall biosynthesis